MTIDSRQPRLRTLQLGMTAAKSAGGGVDRYYFSLLRAFPEADVAATGLVVGDPATMRVRLRAFAATRSADAGMLARWRAFTRGRSAASHLRPTSSSRIFRPSPFRYSTRSVRARSSCTFMDRGRWRARSKAPGSANVAAKAHRSNASSTRAEAALSCCPKRSDDFRT